MIPLSLRRASVRDLDIATKVAESAEWMKIPNRKDAILPFLDGLSLATIGSADEPHSYHVGQGSSLRT